MPQIVYDLKGYPQFVYTAQDFAERKARKQPDIKQLANLLIRSIFEDGGLGRVLSIDEVTPGTPANGWTIRFTGETNGRTADPYIAIYDGEAISYNDDPTRQPRDLGEGLALALEFAAKKDGKNCNKGKPCGGGCIAKGRNCLKDKKDLSKNQQQATDAIAKARPVDVNALKAGAGKIAEQRIVKAQTDIKDLKALKVELIKEQQDYLSNVRSYVDKAKNAPPGQPFADLEKPYHNWDSPEEAIKFYSSDLDKNGIVQKLQRQNLDSVDREIRDKEAEIKSLQRGTARFIYEGRNVTPTQLRTERNRLQKEVKAAKKALDDSKGGSILPFIDKDLNALKGLKDDESFTDQNGVQYGSAREARRFLSDLRQDQGRREREYTANRDQELKEKIAKLRTFDDQLKAVEQGKEPDFNKLRSVYGS